MSGYQTNSRISKLPRIFRPFAVAIRDTFLKKFIAQLPQRPNLYRYHFDCVATSNNTNFMDSASFKVAYQAFTEAYGWDPGLPWRVHQFMWAVDQTRALPGDWVEAGVGRGGLISSALAHYSNWNASNRTLHLFDTFLPYRLDKVGSQIPGNESTKYYAESLEQTKKNFESYENVNFHVGDVFETVPGSNIQKISLLSIDLNFAPAEEFVLREFWPKLVPGGILILDDYAAASRVEQQRVMDKIAKDLNFDILRTPSGQGIVVKKQPL